MPLLLLRELREFFHQLARFGRELGYQRQIVHFNSGSDTSVTVVAGTLKKAGLIKYSRGKMAILNRKGLEAGACECYQIVKRESERLLAS